jgi:hypothetical protein
MRSFLRLLSAEGLKLRRTLALWAVLLAPLLVVFLVGFGITQRDRLPADATTGWEVLAGYSLSFWAGFLLPLFVTLEASLLAGIEHGAHAWKHLFALPYARGAVYGTKLLVVLLLIGLSMLLLFALVVAAGPVLHLLQPGFGFDAPAPWHRLLAACGRVYLGTWGLLALQQAVSLRWASFPVSVGFGIAGWFTSAVAARSEWGPYDPWVWPGLLLDAAHAPRLVPASLALFAAAALAGAWVFCRRDVTS